MGGKSFKKAAELAVSHRSFRALLVLQLLVVGAGIIDREGILLPLVGIPSAAVMFFSKIRITTWKLDWLQGVVGEKDDRVEYIFFFAGLPTCIAWLYVTRQLFTGGWQGLHFWIGVLFSVTLCVGAMCEGHQKMPK